MGSAVQKRLNSAQVLQVLAQITSWMADGHSPRNAQLKAMTELGMARTTAGRYVASAIAHLQADNQTEPIESKRARMVAHLEALEQRALENTMTWTTNGEEVTTPKPDFKAAVSALALKAKIEGLDK